MASAWRPAPARSPGHVAEAAAALTRITASPPFALPPFPDAWPFGGEADDLTRARLMLRVALGGWR